MKSIAMSAGVIGLLIACAGTPDTPRERASMQQQAQLTLEMMTNRDPTLPGLLRSSAGYVVFPEIGKGGFIAGAAHGQGVLYERGRPSGYVELKQGSIGAQVGAQTFAELIVFQDVYDVQRLKTGKFTLGANASAVALTAGVASSTQLRDGVAVFIVPRGGVMAELSVSGQSIEYSPPGG